MKHKASMAGYRARAWHRLRTIGAGFVQAYESQACAGEVAMRVRLPRAQTAMVHMASFLFLYCFLCHHGPRVPRAFV